MMKVLVTGGAGFIGSHAVVLLHEAGYEPIIVDNLSNSRKSVLEGLKKITGKDIKFYEIDCCNEEELDKVFKKEKINEVIHFAAYKSVRESVENPLKYYQNNVFSLISLIRAMKRNNVGNLVFSSSCTVYGIPKKIPVTEEEEIKPANCPYGATKQICEEIIKNSVISGDLKKAVLLRYFNPIGAHPSGLIGELPLGEPANIVPRLTQNAAGILKKIIIFGDDYETEDGTGIRDYIHVMDLADSHIKSFEYMGKNSNDLGIFNIGIGKGVSVMELIKSFEKTNEKKIEYEMGKRREGDVPEIYADVSKAEREMGWKAELSIEDALRNAWKWQENLSKH